MTVFVQRVMPGILLNSPRLAHMYLDNPGIVNSSHASQAAIMVCMEEYATMVHTLRSVSWDRHATVEIIKMEAGIQYKMQPFQKPWWEERRGMGVEV
jgi:hypothetical protein